MNICVVGGGNIGSLILGDIDIEKKDSIRLLTSKPDVWKYNIEVYDSDNVLKKTGRVDIISSNPEDVIKNADIIISTVPSHIFPSTIQMIKPFIKEGAWIGSIPGSGGKEFYCKDLVDNGCVFFGFQRVHGIARVKEYGKSVYDLGKKNELFIATVPNNRSNQVCLKMEQLFRIKCTPLKNYLNVTLTPSNSILHTTRLYTMFHNYEEGICYDRIPSFYSEWTDESSSLLIACDKELQSMCHALKGLDLVGIRPLTEHYESNDSEQMTAKIRSIIAFSKIKTPMISNNGGFIPDLNSRCFLEDFPFGLCIIKAFCDIVGLDTPNIDKVLKWFEKLTRVEFYINGNFSGKDLKDLPLPQNYGLSSVHDIVAYYR